MQLSELCRSLCYNNVGRRHYNLGEDDLMTKGDLAQAVSPKVINAAERSVYANISHNSIFFSNAVVFNG